MIPASRKERLDSISGDRAELLKLLLDRQSRQAQSITHRPRDHQSGPCRAVTSSGQRRLWFIDQLERGAAGYVSTMAFRILGALDTTALQRALDALVQRHETLRTVFDSPNGEPTQVILPESPFALQTFNLTDMPAAERAERIELHKAEETHNRFDLRRGPLVRGRLIRYASSERVLLITMHHIVSDGWSFGVLIRDLGELYDSQRAGRTATLQPLPLQYFDYALWQGEWLQGPELHSQLGYWEQQLSGAPPQLELPTDHSRPAIQSYSGRNVDFTLNAGLCEKLKLLARTHQVTLFMVLYAGWATLLSRLSNQSDIVIGAPIANRQRSELEELIGFFVNTLALRIQLHADTSVAELLAQVRKITLDGYNHQDVPFEKIVEALQPKRTLSRTPLFQVMLALQSAPRHALSLTGLTVTSEPGVDESSICDLFLSLQEQGDEITGTLNYATDLFDRDTVERWLACFTVLLEAMTQNAQRSLGDLPILPETERRRVLHSFNATSAAYRVDRLIHELFEEQVERDPHALAVSSHGQQLSYGEFNAKANQLARHLRRNSVGPDQLVALCLERGAEMIIAMMAVLKAGGAYVPLDPAYPSARLAHIMEDAAPRVVLTQSLLRDRLPSTSAEVIALDEAWHTIDQEPATNLPASSIGLRPSHLAYLIYTSGSTGRPKGVAIEHCNTVNLIFWARTSLPQGIFSRTLHSTSLNFDLSVYECFVPLSCGASVHVVANALALLETTPDVTLINTVPSAIKALVDSRKVPATTRVVNLAGEPLRKELVEQLFANSAVEAICNLYGPSETTTYSTWITLSREAGFVASIGRPIANTQIYILDARGQLAPLGVIGEIFIGGAGVARGYLNKPELTDERFVRDIFSANPAARMYKTGDLGRWRKDGTLEYLGRNDHQIKIRGYRIELGEIEAHLARHLQVKEVVVVAREDSPGEKRLVAYVVADRERNTVTDSNTTQEELSATIVGEWSTIWKETYESQGERAGPDFSGWTSSYTGEPIPEPQMEEWLAGTIARLRALRPSRVLEIGCGVGLVLQHLAPQSDRYVATDFSAPALERLRAWMAGREDLQHVTLLQRSATQLLDFEPGSFDTVILNSVVQYFPDIEYLLTVLQVAVRLLSLGGKIFLGDIRHLGLLPVLHSAVQLSKAAPSVTVRQLRTRIARSIAQEKELLIDPEFFRALPGQISGIRGAELQLKRGRASNELTRYRYDVVLHTAEHGRISDLYEPALESPQPMQTLETRLQQRQDSLIRLGPIPNGRLAADVAAHELIRTSDGDLDVAALRRRLDEVQSEGEDPEQYPNLAAQYGYDAHVEWNADRPAAFDVHFVDRDRPDRLNRALSPPGVAREPWRAYANDPIEGTFNQQLITRLRGDVKESLPEHMIPSVWVILRKLPLTPNGKLDRAALPDPQDKSPIAGDYVAPANPLEQTLAEIWARVLRVERVGRQDNFFELGGHSLLIVQMLEHLRQAGLSADLRCVYASPTLADLAQALTASSAEHFAIPPNRIPQGCQLIAPEMLPLVSLEPEEIQRIAAAVPGGAANIQDIYPLAPLQEGILFHHLLDQQKDVYGRAILLSLSSETTVEAFVSALQTVIDRHDILRTAILWEELSQPVQVVYRRAALVVEELMPGGDRDVVAQLEQRMRLEPHRIDLRRAPLLTLRFARDPQRDRWYALLQTHHLVFDNDSLHTLLTEIATCATGRALELPEALPYRNFVAQAIARSRTHDAETFFRKKLGDLEEPTAPFGLLNVQGDGSRTKDAIQTLQPTLARRIRVQARQLGVSAATLFHAAWALVVSRTAGRDDVVFGTVLLGRLQGSAGTQRALGMFINTLPLRLRLRGTTAGELVESTQRELADLLNHEQASLAIAQRCSGITGNAPLFSALLNYLHSDLRPGAARTALVSGIEVIDSQGRTNYPVSLSVYDHGEAFSLMMSTVGEVDPARVLNLTFTAIGSLVDALECKPETSALMLKVLPEIEREQVIESFNATQEAYSRERLLHELFEEQVRCTPDATAVVYKEQSLTYAQLNAQANQLARHLRAKGVTPDQRVGICVERGPQMVVGLLGILKAGGAYVPLDPSYPAERLAQMLSDSSPEVLLTQAQLREHLPDTDAEVIALDDDWSRIAAQPDTNLAAESLALQPHHLMYVIYTSGSTGKPKGVMIEHAGVVNFLCSLQRELEVVAADCWLAVTTLSFDIAALEIYLPLLQGAKLLVASRDVAHDARELRRVMDEYAVTVLQATPATWQMLLDNGWSGRVGLKALCGGEALSTDLSRKLLSRVSALWNLYGPTETTIWSCVHRIDDVSDQAGFIEPIGRPIANTQIYILSAERQPVPIGVTGEIYISGAGVARGYLNRPELTAERFVDDPFSPVARARMYRTGDLGRWRGEGTIEYLGRNDEQIKIRGYRIELGEIEARLTQHPCVSEAVVLAREDVPGDKRLVAYVTPRAHSELSAETLRVHAKGALPEYMVPSAFVLLQSLPLTANGKLNRRALPAPQEAAYVSSRYEPPRGEIEEILAGVWQSLLRVERVGRLDNFFELGGHSLLIVQMLERLRRVGLSAEVRRIFESPTLADLASALTPEPTGELEVPLNLIPAGCESITPSMLPLVELEVGHIERIVQAVPGGAANIQDIYPLAPLQEGLLFHYLLNERGGDAYARTMLLSFPSREGLAAFTRALQEVIDRHDILRTAILWEQLARPVQVVYRQATLVVEEFALDPDHDPIQQLEERLRPERQRLDLRLAPLMRLQVAAGPESQPWYALLQTHHLVCDNESIAILLSEVIAHCQGRAHELPEPVAYRNHVAQVLARAQKGDAEAFFRDKLGDIDEPTAPFGLLDVHGDGKRTQEAQEALEADLARRVRLQARRQGVSAATLFHAAWALIVAHTSGRDDVVYGTVLLGRLQGSAGAQRILGMFINTLPLRLRLRELTAKELIEETQRELVQLLSHEQVSLAVAQRCSSITGSAPLFSALLNYRHSVSGPEARSSSSAGVTVLSSQGGTNYPIMLSVDDLGEGFVLTAQTDHPIDPQRVIAYASTAMQSLIQALEQAPRTAALSLSILPEHERREVIELFNPAEVLYPRERLIHEAFQEQVERTPDAVAVIHEGQSLTYAELNARANQLARYLRERSVGPDQLVGICLERSLEMVVGLLGILKAGGAYVPLDPSYPSERLRYMLEDSAPRVLLSQARFTERFSGGATEVVMLDRDWEQIAQHLPENLNTAGLGLQPHHLAYVIYTSGSTGRPKGVMVHHAGLWNYVQWAVPHYAPPTEGEAVAVSSPLAFDATITSLYCPLLSGRRVVLVPDGQELEGLERLLQQPTQWCLIKITPSHLQALGQRLQPLKPPCSVRTFVIGGEALPPATVALWQSIWPQTRLINEYGPTETVVGCCIYEVPSDFSQASCVPIGRPIANTRVYLLDRYRQPVPVGVIGEIYIAGAGVARGYLNRPELSAERFVSDPFSNQPQARMYRSGDLGKWRPDGTLEYLGRNDEQVKIRGFRIELGEIEAQLSRHPKVKEAMVLVREDEPGEKRLIAYVVSRSAGNVESDLTVEALRMHLKAVLPDYMIPGAFVILESFPLTANGKLDRRALPAPEMGAYASRAYEAPQGEIEETLAGIWKELLRLERVGRQDNFFELGGHSLLATRVIVRVSELLHVNLPLRALFSEQTLSRVCLRIQAEVDRLTSQEEQRLRSLAQHLRLDIQAMDDTAVSSLIAELERDLNS